MSHPIRKAEIHVWQRTEGTNGVQFIARFYPYKTYPVTASGDTEADVVGKMEALRTEAIEKHEADVIRRQEASARMKASKAAKAKQETSQ